MQKYHRNRVAYSFGLRYQLLILWKQISFSVILNQVVRSDSQRIPSPRPSSQTLRMRYKIVPLNVKCKYFFQIFVACLYQNGQTFLKLWNESTSFSKQHFKTNMTKTDLNLTQNSGRLHESVFSLSLVGLRLTWFSCCYKCSASGMSAHPVAYGYQCHWLRTPLNYILHVCSLCMCNSEYACRIHRSGQLSKWVIPLAEVDQYFLELKFPGEILITISTHSSVSGYLKSYHTKGKHSVKLKI